MQFTDELDVHVAAGSGGDGAVHFARLKYQPFAGPDGGDGGKGGDVVLVATRSVDDLTALRSMKLSAPDGGRGRGNLMFGVDADDLEVRVPPGTFAVGRHTAIEAGEVFNGGDRVVLAKGGKGGRGNVHLATGSRRSPREATPGQPGVELDLTLRYRIACDVALIEPLSSGTADLLLPRLLESDAESIDYNLYRRKPRWIRVEHDYRRYDIAYLPFDYYAEAGMEFPLAAHVYWARRIVVNLLPLGDDTADAWQAVAQLLTRQEYRRLERISVAARVPLPTSGMSIETGEEEAGVEGHVHSEHAETLSLLQAELTGGTID